MKYKQFHVSKNTMKTNGFSLFLNSLRALNRNALKTNGILTLLYALMRRSQETLQKPMKYQHSTPSKNTIKPMDY